MKRLNLLVIVIIVTCFFAGCAGTRKASVETDEMGNISKWDDSNKSLLQPSISPTEIGRANVLNSKADLNRALATQIAGGNVASVAGEYIGVIINQDMHDTLYIQHPDRSDVIQVAAGDHAFIRTGQIPRNIHVCYEGDDKFYKKRLYKKTKVYQGVKIDYGIRLRNS